MNRLQSELHRLYLMHAAAGHGDEATAPCLVDAHAMTRAMVLELSGPAQWEAIARIWRGVQLELELPAPAIAVSGTDGFQLWFSLAEPVAVCDAHAFLESLRMHFVPDIAAQHVRLMPARDSTAPGQAVHAPLVPAEQAHEERWSAFVAADLAPLFAETPWLDMPPGTEGQADLLRRLASIGRAEFEAASAHFAQATGAAGTQTTRTEGSPARDRIDMRAAALDPKGFLLQVMRDDAVDLALRIEAARALLPHFNDPAEPNGD